jgi:magnesium chelatase subunit D
MGPVTRKSSEGQPSAAPWTAVPSFPFPAIVGQEDIKLALILAAVAPQLGGVLVQGSAGTAKSLLARSLQSIMPGADGCAVTPDTDGCGLGAGVAATQVPFVEIPLNVSEDALLGGLDIESTLASGRRVLSSGFLAQADQGCLYLDHANLLAPSIINHISAALDMGQVVVEREGFSCSAPARFTLIAVCDSQEGELPETLGDRIALIVQSDGLHPQAERLDILERAESFERNPGRFAREYEKQTANLRLKIAEARTRFEQVKIATPDVKCLARTAIEIGVVSSRADLFAVRAARASAALAGRVTVIEEDLVLAIRLVLLPRATKDLSKAYDDREAEAQNAGDGDPAETASGGQTESPPGVSTRRQSPDESQSNDSSRAALDQDEQPASDKLEGSNSDINAGGNRSKDLSPQGAGASLSEPIGSLIARAISSPIPPVLQSILGVGVNSRPGHRLSADLARSGRRGASAPAESGRYCGSGAKETHNKGRIAVDATLRAAAPFQRLRRKAVVSPAKGLAAGTLSTPDADRAMGRSTPSAIILKPSDLRFKRFKKKKGTLFIFAVDASGSMATGRIGQAKGTVIRLLQQSYVNRDNVALVAFGGVSATVLLPPTRSVARARISIEMLPAGGATPMAAGVLQALDIARIARRKLASRVILLLLTDGRANVAARRQQNPQAGDGSGAKLPGIAEELMELGRILHKEAITTVVMDTAPQFTSRGDAIKLANWLGAKYVHLPRLDSASIYDTLKQISDRAPNS